MGYNKVMILGNLGADPEMRFTPSGLPVVNFRVAVSRRFYDRDKRLIEETEWFSVVAWGKKAESCNQYLAKGRQVFVEGRLQTRTWQDKDNITRSRPEVVASVIQFIGNRPNKDNDFDADVDAGGSPEETAHAIAGATEKAKGKPKSNRKVIEREQESPIMPEDIPF